MESITERLGKHGKHNKALGKSWKALQSVWENMRSITKR